MTSIGGMRDNRNMKLEKPQNENYAAVIVKIKALTPLEGLDNLVGAHFFGYQAIVSKDTQVGDVGVLFTAETQLSKDFAHENSVYRHSELNKDKEKAGFIEDNRRVRAIKLRGNVSNALFMPLSSLNWTKAKINQLEEGDTFDVLNGKDICNKYVRKVKKSNGANVAQVEEKYVRVDKKFMPEHIDSMHYGKNKHLIKGDTQVVVTQKLHGTSVRIANTLVNRKLSIRDKVAEKLGVKVMKTEFDNVYGSRKVIKDVNNPNQNHYYDSDVWTDTGRKIDGLLPEGYILYGEVIGYVGETPIQKNYTYNVPVGNSELYVYRVATINNQGIQVDLSWAQVKEFCRNAGLKHVPELYVGMHKNFKVDKFIDKTYYPTYKNAVPLSVDSPADEGVCVRAEGITPVILKAKSPIFLEHETKMLDQEVDDIEEEQK